MVIVIVLLEIIYSRWNDEVSPALKKSRKYDRRFGWSISTRKEKYRHSKCTFEHDYIDKQQKKTKKKITVLIVGIDQGCDSKLLFGESISQKFRNSSDLETGLTD